METVIIAGIKPKMGSGMKAFMKAGIGAGMDVEMGAWV